MCNGHSSRTSQGGTIAVLSAPSTPSSGTAAFEGELFFHPMVGQQSGTTATFRSRYSQVISHPSPFHVVIHEKGDMSIPVDQAGFLHTFALKNKCAPSAGACAAWELDQHLDLGVGKTGIIGRRISIFEDAKLMRHVAEGIVGWN